MNFDIMGSSVFYHFLVAVLIFLPASLFGNPNEFVKVYNKDGKGGGRIHWETLESSNLPRIFWFGMSSTTTKVGKEKIFLIRSEN